MQYGCSSLIMYLQCRMFTLHHPFPLFNLRYSLLTAVPWVSYHIANSRSDHCASPYSSLSCIHQRRWAAIGEVHNWTMHPLHYPPTPRDGNVREGKGKVEEEIKVAEFEREAKREGMEGTPLGNGWKNGWIEEERHLFEWDFWRHQRQIGGLSETKTKGREEGMGEGEGEGRSPRNNILILSNSHPFVHENGDYSVSRWMIGRWGGGRVYYDWKQSIPEGRERDLSPSRREEEGEEGGGGGQSTATRMWYEERNDVEESRIERWWEWNKRMG